MRFFFKKSLILKFAILGKKESDSEFDSESNSAILRDPHLRFRIAPALFNSQFFGSRQNSFYADMLFLPRRDIHSVRLQICIQQSFHIALLAKIQIPAYTYKQIDTLSHFNPSSKYLQQSLHYSSRLE